MEAPGAELGKLTGAVRCSLVGGRAPVLHRRF